MRKEYLAEAAIEPDLPIVDPHHHLWILPQVSRVDSDRQNDSALQSATASVSRGYARYLFDDFLRDVRTGHNIRKTVFIEAQPIYRGTGMTSLREVEFANGFAAMAASGGFGEVKVCAAIVGGVNLSLGDVVEDTLVAHVQAGGGRYRGVRSLVCFDEDPSLLGDAGCGIPHLLLDASFRKGFRRLQDFGLSFDVFLLEPQLPDLVDLARSFPGIQIVLDHVGTPIGIGRYAGRREERFPIWRASIFELAQCPNVAVKLGGLGMAFGGFDSWNSKVAQTSLQLATEWRPYIETCIEAFGVNRCMFEGNFPAESATCSYCVLWNAFKRLTAGASDDEKNALFSGAATRIYRLGN